MKKIKDKKEAESREERLEKEREEETLAADD
jgi:hypothetical protein